MPTVKAWIVAIEKYAQQIAGPAPEDQLDIQTAVGNWALELAEFLVEKAHVPRENLTLNLSLRPRREYDERLSTLGVRPRGATLAELLDSIDRLRSSPDDTLLVYWVGHGVLSDRQRYLVCADSKSPGPLRTLTADSILSYFRSLGFPGQQIGFFDTCAQPIPEPPAYELRSFNPVRARQYYFYAASANEYAAADLDRPGFSSEVIRRLKQAGAIPSDPEAFFRELDKAFKDLYDSGALQTRPSDLHYTSGSGELWSRRGYNPCAGVVQINPKWIPFFNRKNQATALENLIEDTPQRENRPLAFVISGPDCEYHEALHERLSQNPLQKLLGRGLNINLVRRLILPDEPGKDEARTFQRVKMSVGDALDARDGGAIWANLPDGLTYLRTRISVGKKLSRASVEVLKALFRLLNDREVCRDLPDRKALCIGVSIEWDKQGPSQKTLQKQFLEANYPTLRFRVLPDLTSPQKTDAKRWTDLVETLKPGVLSPLAADRLAECAKRLFGNLESMPMRDLEDKLMSLCT